MYLQAVIILFLIGFIGDFALQGMAQLPPCLQILRDIKLYQPFWEDVGRFNAALKAGMITLVYGGAFILVAGLIWSLLGLRFNTLSFILFATALAYCLGVILDIFTNRNNWLGPEFRVWYDGMGEERAAIWSGGFAFAVTVFVALMILIRPTLS